MSKEGACEKAIFPDTDIIVTRCAMIGNLSIEGVSVLIVSSVSVSLLPFFLKYDKLTFNFTNETLLQGDRCDLDLVSGCMDPSSHLYNPLANVDDGTCPIEMED